MNRTEQLNEFIKEDPRDPFNHYALALEISKTNPEKALEMLEQILDKFPEYIPTYLITAQLYDKTGKQEQAIKVLKAGIQQAMESGLTKAQREMNSLLMEWTGEI